MAPLLRAVLETAWVGALAAALAFFSTRFSLSDLAGAFFCLAMVLSLSS